MATVGHAQVCRDPSGRLVQLRQYLDPSLLEGGPTEDTELSAFRERLEDLGLSGGGDAHNADEEGHLIVWYGSHTGTAEGLVAMGGTVILHYH